MMKKNKEKSLFLNKHNVAKLTHVNRLFGGFDTLNNDPTTGDTTNPHTTDDTNNEDSDLSTTDATVAITSSIECTRQVLMTTK